MWTYLEQRFKATAEEASRVLDVLLTHYWRPSSAGSWRVYVERWIYFGPERKARRQSQRPHSRVSRSESGHLTVAEAAAEPAPEMMHWCELHSANMQRRGKDGDIWYSHRLPNGKYCKGESGAA